MTAERVAVVLWVVAVACASWAAWRMGGVSATLIVVAVACAGAGWDLVRR